MRDAARARDALGDKGAGVEYVAGDVRDRKSIDAALAGVTAIVSTIGATRNDPANTP